MIKAAESTLYRDLSQMNMRKRRLQVEPGNAAAWVAWSLHEQRAQHPERANELLAQCIRRNPSHEPALHAIAMLEISVGNFDQARKRLQKALRLNPAHVHSWTTLARISFWEGNADQAREVYKDGMRHCGPNASLLTAWSQMEAEMQESGASGVDFRSFYLLSLRVLCRLQRPAGLLTRAVMLQACCDCCSGLCACR